MRGTFLVILLFAGVGPAMASDFATLSGEELIRLLQDPAWRMRAYHELDLRSDSATESDAAAFEDKHRNPEVVACPQPDGSSLYVVLSDAFSHYRDDSEEPPREQMPHDAAEIPPRHDLLIEVFSPGGRRINPLPCNDNVLDGLLADINRDGFVERAHSISFGVEGVRHADVMKVERMADPVAGMLAVLYNWGDLEDWGYTFSDRNRDGVLEIDFGALTLEGLKPKVTFRWDGFTQSYVQDGSSDHLIVLNPTMGCCTGTGLTASLPKFPGDPDAAKEADLLFLRDGELPPLLHPKTPPASGTYRPISLAGADNEEIYSYMGRGKDFLDVENEEYPRTTIPAEFWTSPPAEAALQLADANRTAAHRSKYQLRIEDGPPDPAVAALSLVEGGAHWDMDYSYLLKAGKQNSYVSIAAMSGSYQRDGDPFYEPPTFNIQVCDIPNNAAKQAVAVLSRLHRIRTDPAGKADDRHGFWSTGDGNGTAQWFVPGSKDAVFTASGDIGGSVAKRWDSSFEEEEYIGIVSEVFRSAIPEIAKPCWTEGKKQVEDLHPAVRKLLALFSPDQSAVTYVTAEFAVQAAGVLGFTELRPRIEAILTMLPQQPAHLRCEDEVWNELESEQANFKSLTPSAGDWEKVGAQMDTSLARSESLMQEWDALETGANADCNIRDLRSSIAVTLRQLAHRDDAAALQGWIEAREPDWRWALWRLQQLDAPRAAAILESFLKTAPDDSAAAGILERIGKLDRRRAQALAKERLDPQHPEIYPAAFFQLDKADEDARINELLQLAISEQTDYSIRHDILQRAVPQNAPNQFESRDVDRALQNILHLQPSDRFEDLRGESAHALVLRNGVAAADDVLQGLEDSSGFSTVEILRDAEDLYPGLDSSRRARLQNFLQASLSRHSGAINDLALVAWILDLRAFKPQFETLATSAPEDFESDNCSQWNEEDTIGIHCHGARMVAALWHEPDPLTRFKMLFSWYHAEPYNFDWLDALVFKYRRQMLKSRLESDLKLMTPKQRKEAMAFVDWCMTTHPYGKYQVDYEPELRRLAASLREP